MLNNQVLEFVNLVGGFKFLVKAQDFEYPIFKHKLFEAEYIAYFKRMGITVEMLTSKTMLASFDIDDSDDVNAVFDRLKGVEPFYVFTEHHWSICGAYEHDVKFNISYKYFIEDKLAS